MCQCFQITELFSGRSPIGTSKSVSLGEEEVIVRLIQLLEERSQLSVSFFLVVKVLFRLG